MAEGGADPHSGLQVSRAHAYHRDFHRELWPLDRRQNKCLQGHWGSVVRLFKIIPQSKEIEFLQHKTLRITLFFPCLLPLLPTKPFWREPIGSPWSPQVSSLGWTQWNSCRVVTWHSWHSYSALTENWWVLKYFWGTSVLCWIPSVCLLPCCLSEENIDIQEGKQCRILGLCPGLRGHILFF